MTKVELKQRIEELKREKGAVILAHYYTSDDVQEVADFLGDSLALSVKARDIDAPIILFAGVNFMAETAKVLSPEKIGYLLNLGASIVVGHNDGTFLAFELFDLRT